MKNRFSRPHLWPMAGLTLAMIATSAAAQNAPEAKPEPRTVAATPSATPPVTPSSTSTPTDTGAVAQAAIANAPSEDEVEVLGGPLLQVGDAATSLLEWQREGVIASPTTRPIAGDVAQRSYERYLKSFEFPIPERFNSTVKATSSAASGSK